MRLVFINRLIVYNVQRALIIPVRGNTKGFRRDPEVR